MILALMADQYIVEIILGAGAIVLGAMHRASAQRIGQLSDRVEKLEQAKDELHEQIRTQAEEIGHLTAERDALKREVRSLKLRLSDLERDDHRPQEGLA